VEVALQLLLASALDRGE